jgi:hypothetical protein
VLTGKGRERVVAAALKAFANAPEKLFPEYPFFPDPLHEPYLSTFLRKELGIPESDMVVAGMSMGYADNGLPVNHMVLDKFGPEKFAKFVDI